MELQVELLSEAFGVVVPEAYMPQMVDRGYTLEKDHSSFLGSGLEEEAPEAELFKSLTEASTTTGYR